MMGAPSTVSAAQLKELAIRVVEPAKAAPATPATPAKSGE
jgi:hypothetical protein